MDVLRAFVAERWVLEMRGYKEVGWE